MSRKYSARLGHLFDPLCGHGIPHALKCVECEGPCQAKPLVRTSSLQKISTMSKATG
jgi:hypothetical protein